MKNIVGFTRSMMFVDFTKNIMGFTRKHIYIVDFTRNMFVDFMKNIMGFTRKHTIFMDFMRKPKRIYPLGTYVYVTKPSTYYKPEPIMLLVLSIITLSRISHHFHPLFFICICSHAITYYSILFLKFDCVACKIASIWQLINECILV